ncbi:hypothetical protein [Dactylosporangium sp. CA-139066]|uniref:hypothetical protein n=1 Tax=Dactylosporangium sp. CA-139066 TaxID=3239930 RepID=UPI003D919C0A
MVVVQDVAEQAPSAGQRAPHHPVVDRRADHGCRETVQVSAQRPVHDQHAGQIERAGRRRRLTGKAQLVDGR